MKKIVSIQPDGVADVYDLQVDEHHNFALGNGVVVHNSQWGAKDVKLFMPERFKVLVGNQIVSSKLLAPEEDVEKYEAMEEVQIIDVPMDFYDDFKRDLDTAIRDLAGISTVAITPFFRNREKIVDMFTKDYEHPFTQEIWDMTDNGKFLTEALFKMNIYGERVPRIHPEATRHVHFDTSLRNDATGICIAHSYGYKEIRRTLNGVLTIENRPIIYVDLILRVKPRMGEDIIFADLRRMVYALHEMGLPIRFLSADSFQSSDMLQAFREKGYEAEVVSVDRPMDAYETLKAAVYEDRVVCYEYPILSEELRRLEYDAYKGKVDHTPDFSKDCADALAGVVYTLTTKHQGEGSSIYVGNSTPANKDDYAYSDSEDSFGNQYHQV